MFKSIKKRLKDQRGLTLVELLAVIVILGIIAGIAVPNIGGIIDNSKRDVHVSNVHQLVDATKLYVVAENIKVPTTGVDVKLSDLISKGFIETIKDPSGNGYNTETTLVTVTKDASNKIVYSVDLKSGADTTAKTYAENADPNGTIVITNYK